MRSAGDVTSRAEPSARGDEHGCHLVINRQSFQELTAEIKWRPADIDSGWTRPGSAPMSTQAAVGRRRSSTPPSERSLSEPSFSKQREPCQWALITRLANVTLPSVV